MAKLLSDKDTAEITKFFSEQMVNPVTLRLFVQDPDQPGECDYCSDTEQIVREVAALNDKIKVVVHKTPTDRAEVDKFNVEHVPALIFERQDGTDSGVRFYGIPSGYEFGTLLEDIADLSNGNTKLSPELIQQVQQVQQDVTIKVFVTPTWPYCPRAVRTAHQLAMLNPHIRAEAVEASEFPELSEKYNVYGVPKSVINEGIQFEGAVPDNVFVENLMKAVQ